MSAMSNYLENKFLDHFLGTSSTSAPAAVYIGLHTADPTDAGTGAGYCHHLRNRAVVCWQQSDVHHAARAIEIAGRRSLCSGFHLGKCARRWVFWV